MLAIGRALMARPKLLLLDEPSLGLAPVIVDKIYEIVREINARGTFWDLFLPVPYRAGGKALALAAIMQNQGHILAFDDEPTRLKPVRPRARRSGATIIGVTEKRGGHHWGNGRFDVVLVDAPCSGSGTWRRNPELKWRLTPERLDAVAKVQSWLLADGARHTQSRGRLVYATCSILPRENEDQVEAFLAVHPDFRAIDAADAWREATDTDPPPGMAQFFHASPHTTRTDGFFAAVFARA